VAEICRKLEITEGTFYQWMKKLGDLGVSELRELRQLREDNRKLKGLVADLSLGKQIPQESLRQNGAPDRRRGSLQSLPHHPTSRSGGDFRRSLGGDFHWSGDIQSHCELDGGAYAGTRSNSGGRVQHGATAQQPRGPHPSRVRGPVYPRGRAFLNVDPPILTGTTPGERSWGQRIAPPSFLGAAHDPAHVSGGPWPTDCHSGPSRQYSGRMVRTFVIRCGACLVVLVREPSRSPHNCTNHRRYCDSQKKLPKGKGTRIDSKVDEWSERQRNHKPEACGSPACDRVSLQRIHNKAHENCPNKIQRYSREDVNVRIDGPPPLVRGVLKCGQHRGYDGVANSEFHGTEPVPRRQVSSYLVQASATANPSMTRSVAVLIAVPTTGINPAIEPAKPA